MTITTQIARQFRELHSGSSMTGACLMEKLDGISLQQATTHFQSLNSIAVLLFHINYYIAGLIEVLQGGQLTIRDKYSYDMPTLENEAAWEQMKAKAFADAETFAALVEQMPDSRLLEPFVEEKYGTWYRNLTGLIEHSHYHLGQISLIRKIVLLGDDMS